MTTRSCRVRAHALKLQDTHDTHDTHDTIHEQDEQDDLVTTGNIHILYTRLYAGDTPFCSTPYTLANLMVIRHKSIRVSIEAFISSLYETC